MTRERLQRIPLDELKALAVSEGYEFSGSIDRSTLIDFILENTGELGRERKEENNPSVRVEESKYDIAYGEEPEEDGSILPSIPITYNQTKIVLMVRDPNWAFAYWNMDRSLPQRLGLSTDVHHLVLRVHDVELVEFNGENSNSFFDIPIQLSDRRWYIYLPNPNCSYVIELGLVTAVKYECLARSNTVRTPRDSLSEKLPDESIAQEIDSSLLGGFYSYRASSEGIPQRILSTLRD
jgi:hypothetical protein